MPRPNVENTVHAPDMLVANKFVMNEWEFGFSTVGSKVLVGR